VDTALSFSGRSVDDGERPSDSAEVIGLVAFRDFGVTGCEFSAALDDNLDFVMDWYRVLDLDFLVGESLELESSASELPFVAVEAFAARRSGAGRRLDFLGELLALS
jgi:hypothetical protein